MQLSPERKEKETLRGSSKEGETLENVPLPSPGARVSIESEVEATSGWSSTSSGSLKKSEKTEKSENETRKRPQNAKNTSSVLDKIALFHQHHHARGRDATTCSLHRTLSIHTTALEQTYMTEECDENDYHLDLDSYKPVQPLHIEHGVTLFPIAASHVGTDLHLLQVRIIHYINNNNKKKIIIISI